MTLFLHLWHVAVWVSAVLLSAAGVGAIWWAVDAMLSEVSEALKLIAKALQALQLHARYMTHAEAASIVSQIEGLEEQFDATATIAGERAEALEREADAVRDPIRCITCRKPLRDDPSGNPFRCATCQRKAVWG